MSYFSSKTYTYLFLLYWVGFAITLSAQQQQQHTYDELGRLIRIVYANGTVVEYQYDAASNRTREIINAGASLIENPVSVNVSEGGTNTFQAVLTAVPDSTVTVTLTSGTPAKATVSPGTLTFTTGDWGTPRTVTITGVQDGDQNHENVTVTLVASGGLTETDTLAVRVFDDEAPLTMQESKTSITMNEGTSESFTVVLTRQPASSVSVAISSNNTNSVTVSPASLTFTTADWFNAQLVTVNAIEDANTSNENVTVTLQATGGLTETDTVSVAVNDNDGSNVSPYAAVTYPTDNTTYNIYTDLTIEADAYDNDGTVSKVEFYDGDTLLGTDTSSPYTCPWNTGLPGTHVLKVIATDNWNATYTSSLININVTGNPPPVVSITSPSEGQKFTTPTNITINADAYDLSGGSVTKVDFYYQRYGVWTYLDTDTSSPYSYTWNNVTAENYVLKAIATDNQSATNTATLVNIMVRNPCSMAVSPSESFGSGGNPGGPFTPGSTIYTINANGDDVVWTASADANWLTVTPANGTATPFTPSQLSVQINSNANSLSQGTYTGTVTLTNTTNGQGNTSRQVILNVGGSLWQKTNGPAGGQVWAIAVNATSNLIFAGTSDGIFRSSDNGNSWTAANNGLVNTILCLVIKNSTGAVFAGTINAGVYRSTDNGDSWTQINNGISNYRINVLAINPSTGVIFAGTYGGGVFRSSDNGNSWTAVNSGLTDTYVSALAVHSTLGTLFVSIAPKVYRSSDNGNNWTQVSNGLPALVYANAITIQPTTGAVFLGTTAWVYRSTDNGDNWTQLAASPYTTRILGTNSSGTLFSGDNGFYRSSDNGDSWTQSSSGIPNTYYYAFANHTGNGNLFVGTQLGIYRSSDNGVSWTQTSSGIKASYAADLAVQNSRGFLFAATMDRIHRTNNQGDTWTKLSNGLPTDYLRVDKVAVNKQTATVFAGIYGYGIYRSSDNGDTWAQVNNGLTYTQIQDIETHPDTGAIFVATSNGGVFRSTNNGDSWTQINNGMSRVTIYSLAINTSANLIFAGGYSTVYRSGNNGDNWTPLTSGISSVGNITALAVHATTGYIFAGTYGGIYRSTNNGDSWTQVKSNLRVIALTSHPSLGIFAGLDGQDGSEGVYRSLDNGATWSQMNEGLTNLYIRSLAIDTSANILFAGTSGSGVFRRQFPLPAVTVTSPNGGENWAKDVENTIAWNTNDAGVNRLDIFYSGDNGNNWDTLTTDATNDGTYTWLVDKAVTSTALIKIIAYDAANNQAIDQSNAVFGIFQPNRKPVTPYQPSPAHNATGVSVNSQLGWLGGDPDAGDSVTYDVYLGTTNPPELRQSNHATTAYNPGTLLTNTTYYWKVVGRDNHGETGDASPVWQFTTGTPQVALTVTSPYGNPQGNGSYVVGSQVTASVSSPTTLGRKSAKASLRTMRYQCTGFTGTGSSPATGNATSLNFALSQNSTITFNWVTQYQLTTTVNPPAAGTISQTNGDGWYNTDAVVQLTAVPNAGYVFSYWSQDIQSEQNPANITMSSARQVTANFAKELDHLTISGAATVTENTSQTYTCRAYYADGSNQIIQPSWDENSQYAQIIYTGELQASEVTANENCTIQATYSENNITKTATKDIVIENKKVLQSIEVEGPTTVKENCTQDYNCRATYDDSSNELVEPQWEEDSAYAEISAAGLLTTHHVAASQSVTITATYTLDGVTKNDTHTVAITPRIPNDFDGDGKSDIVWHHNTGHFNYMWFMNGSSVRESLPTLYVDTEDWKIIGTGDFDGDNKSDLLWHYTSRYNYVWFMNGATLRESLSIPYIDTDDWQIQHLGDFDGDGKSDIFWHHGPLYYNYMWFMNGANLREALPTSYLATNDWQFLRVGDFDGDGKSDLFWHHATLYYNYIWFMNGATIRESLPVTYIGNDEWQIVGVGDVDGDGKCDILWQHTSGLIYAWFMNGATLKSTAELGSVSGAGWKVAGTGDYDGNGQADVFFRNTTTGENLVWLRVGSTTNAYTLSNLDIAWKVAGYTLQYIRDTAATADSATMIVQAPRAETMRVQPPTWRTTMPLPPRAGEVRQRILEPKK